MLALLDFGAPEVMNLGTGNALLVFIKAIDDWRGFSFRVAGRRMKRPDEAGRKRNNIGRSLTA